MRWPVSVRSRIECRSSGGLAQLGEHYVRNVGVGGSTPLPSTKPSLLVLRAFPPSSRADKTIPYLPPSPYMQ